MDLRRYIRPFRPSLFARSSREWAADGLITGIAAVLGVLVLLGALADNVLDEEINVLRDLTLGAAACAALLLFRRRHPTGLAVILVIGGTLVANSTLGAVAMAIFTVAAHRPWRATAAVGGLAAVLVAGLWALAPISTRDYVEGVTTVLLAEVGLIASGMLVRSQRQLVQSLRERARQAEEGQRLRVEEARHLERERLAREMHDVLAHRISLLAVHAGALEFRPGAAPAEARAAGVIRQCAHEAMEDLREVIGMLRQVPGGADPQRPQPTLTDLPALIEESRQAGAQVTLDDRIGDLPRVPARIGRHAYRVVQEGLTNARKHAPGARVLVRLEGSPGGGLLIEIGNPLPLDRTAAPLPGAGAGLIGLRERVELVGGRLEHGAAAGGRFRLAARLPWPA